MPFPEIYKELPRFGLGYQCNRPKERSWLRKDIIADLTAAASFVNDYYMVEVVNSSVVKSRPPDLLILDCGGPTRINLDGHPPSSHVGTAYDCSYYCGAYLFVTALIVQLVSIHAAYTFRVGIPHYPQIQSVLKKRKEFDPKVVEIIQKGYKGNQVITVDSPPPAIQMHLDHIHVAKGAL